MKRSDILAECCGVDELKEAKAAFLLNGMHLPNDIDPNSLEGNAADEYLDFELNIDNPPIEICEGPVFTTIDIKFDSYSDYDYIQCVNALYDFNTKKLADTTPYLQLTIMPKTSFGNVVVIARNMVWTLIPSKPNVLADTIRFICLTDNFEVLITDDESLDEAADYVEGEDE